MGLLRLILAFSVVMAHTHLLRFFPAITGEKAVSVFFVISGFYMSLVLNDKYPANKKGRITFWKARALRLYPAYLLVMSLQLLGLVALAAIGRAPVVAQLAKYRAVSPFALFLVIVANIALFGQDAITFCGVDASSHSLYFLKDFHEAPVKAYPLLLVPQAWSLSVELLFYLVAPFIVIRSWKVVLPICVALVAAKLIICHRYQLTMDPWTYRFFPFELNLFLYGALAHRAYQKVASSGFSKYILGYWAYPLVLAFSYFIAVDQIPLEVVSLCTAVLLPILFSFTKNLRFDRWIGELSYPVYIIHGLVIWGLRNTIHGGLPTILLFTLLSSIAIVKLVDEPVDRLRQKLTKRSVAATSEPASA